MSRRPSAAILVSLIVIAACTPSRVDPKTDITLSGNVRRQGEKPIAGARLALTREGDPGDVILTVATLGFACLTGDDAPAICRSARFTTAGPDGTFTYSLQGRDTQSTLGFSAVLSLTTGVPAKADESAGASTTYRFHVQTEKLALPIRIWEPKLAARIGSFGARVHYTRLPSGLVPRQIDQGTDHTVEFARGGEVVWRIERARPGVVFDPRVLEDSAGTMRVIAAAAGVNASDQLGDEVAFAMRSGARQYESPLGPPVSRGKPCSVADEKGMRYPVAPCEVTDSDFSERFAPSVCSGASGCVEPRIDATIVDLQARVPVDLIVVRGCGLDRCRVETSPDARSWRVAGTIQSEDAVALRLATPRPARYVRVSGFAAVDDLTEISVWAGRHAVPDASLLVAPGRFPTPGPGRATAASAPSTTKERGFNYWALGAATLFGAVAGALLALVLRRSKRLRV